MIPETGADYPVRVSLYKDIVTVALDTTGESLHKRGYRKLTSKAPIEETLAAALIMLTPWNKDRILVDPFCGSGTFPIEAAMMAANMAPGMNRSFLSEDWKQIIPRKCWYDAMDEAHEMVDDTVSVDIQGYDLDPEVIKAARANAELAGVAHMIHFQQRPVAELSHPKKYGFLITNPPYGERIEEKRIFRHCTPRSGNDLRRWTAGLRSSSLPMKMWRSTWDVGRPETARFTTV